MDALDLLSCQKFRILVDRSLIACGPIQRPSAVSMATW
jgi:hypothetical protein